MDSPDTGSRSSDDAVRAASRDADPPPAVPADLRVDWQRTAQRDPDQDDFDVLGAVVADMLRTAHARADQTRRDADEYAATERSRADREVAGMRDSAERELAIAERRRRQADWSMETAERRLAEADRVLESARSQAEEMLTSAHERRDAVLAEAAREGERLLTAATRLFQRRLLDVQTQHEEAGQRLRHALASLETLSGDLALLQPDAVLDLTGAEARVEVPSCYDDLMAKSIESWTPNELQNRSSPPSDETAPAPPEDPEKARQAGEVDDGEQDGDPAEDETTDRPAAWLNSVVQDAVTRAFGHWDGSDGDRRPGP